MAGLAHALASDGKLSTYSAKRHCAASDAGRGAEGHETARAAWQAGKCWWRSGDLHSHLQRRRVLVVYGIKTNKTGNICGTIRATNSTPSQSRLANAGYTTADDSLRRHVFF